MVISQKITFPHLWRAPKSNNTVCTNWEPSAKKRKEHLFILKLSLYPTHIYVLLTKPLPQRPHLCLHSSQGLSAASWSSLLPTCSTWSTLVQYGVLWSAWQCPLWSFAHLCPPWPSSAHLAPIWSSGVQIDTVWSSQGLLGAHWLNKKKYLMVAMQKHSEAVPHWK